jgi:hypothetical protein
MKQTLGIGVILAVAVAAVRFSAGPSAPTLGVASGATVPQPLPSHPSTAINPSAYRGGCSAFDPEDPKATYPKDDNRAAAKSVLDKFFALKSELPSSETLKQANYTRVRYAIAMAPDPRHTNLSLSFDREMVLIQQAAQDEGYTYDSSWLPWKDDTFTFPLLQDQQRTDDDTNQREACPGILLFRRSVNQPAPDKPDEPLNPAKPSNPYAEALVVFVVGEQPTGGLNEDQWANAVHWLATNPPPDGSATLNILGPTFSGSLVSMQRDLARLYRDPPLDPDSSNLLRLFPNVHLLSGGVTGCSSIRWFERQLEDTQFHRRIIFGTFAENDELQIYRFLSYVHSQRTLLRDIAILSEDETAYANDASDLDSQPSGNDRCTFQYDPQDRPVKLSYPRDISALRSAYEKQSVFSSPSQSPRTVHPILQESAELEGGNSNASDTIRSYSGLQGAIAQEAILYGVVSNLRVHHTRYLLLRCSNPLDFLFLTRFFHRAYPETRIVTVTSDLLFGREIDTTEFRGVLSLANYSLLPRDQHWSRVSKEDAPPLAHTHRIFDANDQGSYIAARYLFDANAWPISAASTGAVPVTSVIPVANNTTAALTVSTGLTLPLKENIPDYADPFWMHDPSAPIQDSNAPVWLSVLGRDGYWPIAVLNNDTLLMDGTRVTPPSTIVKLHSDDAHYDLAPQKSSQPRQFSDALLFGLPLSWSVCLAFANALLLYQLFAIAIGSDFTSSGLFAPFRQMADYPSQAVLLGINSAFVVMLPILLFSAAIAVPDVNYLDHAFRDFWVWAVIDAFAVIALLLSFIFHKKDAALDLRPGGIRAALVFVFALALLVAIALSTLFQSSTPVNNASIFLRMSHLTSGVSPLVPILFLFFGFYLWTWQALAGNILLANGRPLLPTYCGPQKTFGWLKSTLTNPVSIRYGLARAEYRISEEIAKRIIHIASPVCVAPRILILPLAVGFAARYLFPANKLPLLSMESHSYAIWINLALLIAFLLTTAEAVRLYLSWIELRRLLLALNLRHLRRTFSRLRNVGPRSLWSVSGTVQRIQFLFFSRQLDAARRLQNHTEFDLPRLCEAIEYGRRFSINTAEKVSAGSRWEMPIEFQNDSQVASSRVVLADAVAEVLNEILLPCWADENISLNLECSPTESGATGSERPSFDIPLSKYPSIRAAEEFVCFHYIAFIQNVLARMRTMILSMIFLFVGVCLSISFYPFVPRTEIGLWLTANLAVIAAAVIYVYAGMERDETLSYITNTPPGRLSSEFYIKTATFLVGPVLGLLTTQFPAISESILGWLQPGLDALR